MKRVFLIFVALDVCAGVVCLDTAALDHQVYVEMCTYLTHHQLDGMPYPKTLPCLEV